MRAGLQGTAVDVAEEEVVEPCDECGFVYDLAAASRAGQDIRAAADELAALLTSSVDPPSRRTSPQLWSPLEYACHVRDVLLTQRERVLLARRVQVPVAVPMGRDERVAHEGYAEQNPVEVAEELTMAARLLANALDRLDIADWELRVAYNWPEHTERTLRWLAAHTLHDVRHHLLDVRRQLPAAP
ncbi:DinB family protein [Mycolicibacterium mengxianglii]|uniref:DinB family protein n=1 Tax=Mycolicibacterium mengxianglii TaxID=2736649 RepID=UPI0027DA4543|nr:DinB family protein [Mycolicibacterium mengxianglii]